MPAHSKHSITCHLLTLSKASPLFPPKPIKLLGLLTYQSHFIWTSIIIFLQHILFLQTQKKCHPPPLWKNNLFILIPNPPSSHPTLHCFPTSRGPFNGSLLFKIPPHGLISVISFFFPKLLPSVRLKSTCLSFLFPKPSPTISYHFHKFSIITPEPVSFHSRLVWPPNCYTLPSIQMHHRELPV